MQGKKCFDALPYTESSMPQHLRTPESSAPANAAFAAVEESSILSRAIQVIGSRREALRWMGTPVRALSYATPISLLHSAKGRKSVLAILDKLEHGVL
jgi:putative toxin-antitoxin system antitoxin component (TIGR02293 family)